MKNKISLSLKEYNKLLSFKNNQFDENNHVYFNTNALIKYLDCNVKIVTPLTHPDTIQMEVSPSDNSITTFSGTTTWIKTIELLGWLEQFKSVDINTIKNLRIGYILGFQTPFINSKGLMSASNVNGYLAFCNIEYYSSQSTF